MNLTLPKSVFLALSIYFLLILLKEKEYILNLKEESHHERVERQEIKYEKKKVFTTAKSSVLENAAEDDTVQMKWTPSTDECKPVGAGVFFSLRCKKL